MIARNSEAATTSTANNNAQKIPPPPPCPNQLVLYRYVALFAVYLHARDLRTGHIVQSPSLILHSALRLSSLGRLGGPAGLYDF